jgi:hypothetical protein
MYKSVNSIKNWNEKLSCIFEAKVVEIEAYLVGIPAPTKGDAKGGPGGKSLSCEVVGKEGNPCWQNMNLIGQKWSCTD